VAVTDLVAQLQANFPVVEPFAEAAAGIARSLGLFDEVDGTEVLNLARLHEPDRMEHDASLSRDDLDPYDPSIGLLVSDELAVQLFDSDPSPVVTRQQLQNYLAARIRNSRREKEDFDMNPSAGQACLVMFWGQVGDLDYVDKDILRSILFDEEFPQFNYDPADFDDMRFDLGSGVGAECVAAFTETVTEALEADLIPLCSENSGLAFLQNQFGSLGLVFCDE